MSDILLSALDTWCYQQPYKCIVFSIINREGNWGLAGLMPLATVTAAADNYTQKVWLWRMHFDCSDMDILYVILQKCLHFPFLVMEIISFSSYCVQFNAFLISHWISFIYLPPKG